MSSRFWTRAGCALMFPIFVSGCSATSAVVGATAVTTRTVLQERSMGDAVDDTRIEIEVNAALLNKDHVLFGQVATEVVEGRVLLVGDVQRREDRVTAAELAWSVKGVREVINEINVAESGGVQGFAEDVYVSNNVRARLLTGKDVSSFNYNVETIDGVVHLIGLAQSRSELRRVANIAATTPGVERVVSHVLIIDDPRRTASSLMTTSATSF
jgi:osmotically-inducible protein OsmY